MKLKILIIGTLLVTLSCKAQHIIPVEETYKYTDTIGGLMGDKTYVYVKDVNNVLDKFVGRWKGNNHIRNYEFVVTKVTTFDGELKEDKLIMTYKIVRRDNGIIEFKTTGYGYEYIMDSGYVAKSGSYVFDYVGYENACGQNGNVFLGILNGSSDRYSLLFLEPEGEIYPECNGRKINQILPTSQIFLTKQ